MTKQDQVVCPFCRKSTELQKGTKHKGAQNQSVDSVETEEKYLTLSYIKLRPFWLHRPYLNL